MVKYIDTHAHYDDDSFDFDRDLVLSSLQEKNICGIVNCASDIKSAKTSIELAEKYNFCWAAVGVHPHSAAELSEDWLMQVEQLAAHDKVVAIGEIGLDYHYDFAPKDKQKQVLASQLELANKLDLPVVIHDREAHGDIIDILRQYKPKGVIHCFSGSVEMMKEIVKLGMYVGFGGSVTFKNAKHPLMAAGEIPIDRLVLETDAPYLAPIPFRGRRNDSSLIEYTADVIANQRGITKDELYEATTQNALKLFPKMRVEL